MMRLHDHNKGPVDLVQSPCKATYESAGSSLRNRIDDIFFKPAFTWHRIFKPNP